LGDDFAPVSASSRHTGGVNVLLTEGSVRFITNAIDTEIWWGMGSRNRGEMSRPGD
jgi:hypothetical protein